MLPDTDRHGNYIRSNIQWTDEEWADVCRLDAEDAREAEARKIAAKSGNVLFIVDFKGK